nr:hypothetical protein [Gimesia maris]
MNTTLTDSQLDRWNQTGYIKLPEFLSEAETQNLREWVEEISAWPADDEKWMHHFEQTPSGVRPARTEYILAFHAGIRQLLTQGKIPDCAGALMGEPAILYKEKINYKYPGAAAMPHIRMLPRMNSSAIISPAPSPSMPQLPKTAVFSLHPNCISGDCCIWIKMAVSTVNTLTRWTGNLCPCNPATHCSSVLMRRIKVRPTKRSNRVGRSTSLTTLSRKAT